ncbi:MAG: hypothetical protein JNK23_13385 [Opitutaceae bacterium]|nr:hypothetical protein [Opitutaceae bacterium]
MRRALACGLAAAALLLGGCVYLRLLELKLQLDQFDRHFAVETGEGLALTCLSPTLRADDVRWIGLRPESVRADGRDEHWHVRWVKELPPGVTEPGVHDLALDLGFTAGRLSRLAVPEKYFALMPKEFVTAIIRSVGRGRVDQAGRSLATTLAESDLAAARPRLAAIGQLLGAPSERRIEGTETMMRYRYRPATPEPGAEVFEMLLHFDTASGELLRWRARTPVGNLAFDFTRRRATK